MNKLVGYLFAEHNHVHPGNDVFVKCPECMGSVVPGERDYMGVVYDDNVLPYRQTCHVCDKILVAGQTEKWCELYPNPTVCHLVSNLPPNE